MAAVGPDIEQRLPAAEIDGGGEQGQCPDELGLERRQQGRQRPSHAVADQVQALDAVFAPHDLDDGGETPAYVVVQREHVVRVGRNAPVDHVDVEAGIEVAFDDASTRQEIEDVRAVDQGVREQYGAALGRRRLPTIAEQAQGAHFEDDVV